MDDVGAVVGVCSCYVSVLPGVVGVVCVGGVCRWCVRVDAAVELVCVLCDRQCFSRRSHPWVTDTACEQAVTASEVCYDDRGAPLLF